MQETELGCQRCGHGFGAHSLEELPGAHCRAAVSNSPAYRLPCPCPGFAWLPPGAPAVTYSGAPEPVFHG